MDVVENTVGAVVVLQPGERLDVGAAPDLKRAVHTVFDKGHRRLVIDLSRVNYISSIGLGACIESAKRAQAEGARIALAALAPTVAEVFDTTGITELFEIHASRDHAVDALHRRFVPSLPEEALLLLLADEGGRFIDLPSHALEFALAGAVLLDLGLHRRLDCDRERLLVADASPVGDDILDPVLASIASAETAHDASWWIRTLTAESLEIRRRSIDRLVAHGVLRRDNHLLHWVRGERRHPVADDRGSREVRQRVLSIVRGNEIPTPRDVAIISLADACAVFDALLSMDEMLDVRARIADVARMDLLTLAMAEALQDAQSGGGPGEAATNLIFGRPADGALSR